MHDAAACVCVHAVCARQLVTYGNMYRRRGSTGVNAKSSRSHAVLLIDLRRKHHDDKLARSVTCTSRNFSLLSQ